jgi:hypothetical protein
MHNICWGRGRIAHSYMTPRSCTSRGQPGSRRDLNHAGSGLVIRPELQVGMRWHAPESFHLRGLLRGRIGQVRGKEFHRRRGCQEISPVLQFMRTADSKPSWIGKSKHRRQFRQDSVAIVNVLLRKLRLSRHGIEIQENLAFVFSIADENLHCSPVPHRLNRESTPTCL